MKTTKKVSEIKGKEGTVYRADGASIPRVQYHFDVWAEYAQAGDQWVEGVPDFRGRVYLDHDSMIACVMSGEKLTLHLEDGRWIDFSVSGPDEDVIILSNLRENR